jgi:hypothetical protein
MHDRLSVATTSFATSADVPIRSETSHAAYITSVEHLLGASHSSTVQRCRQMACLMPTRAHLPTQYHFSQPAASESLYMQSACGRTLRTCLVSLRHFRMPAADSSASRCAAASRLQAARCWASDVASPSGGHEDDAGLCHALAAQVALPESAALTTLQEPCQQRSTGLSRPAQLPTVWCWASRAAATTQASPS